ncbi:MAG: transporter substrate-binding domain-containing protein [Caldilineaceae bacterium]|nr:transporter substrate-binding domain-containing protein [Caldilineaceae bacterium]
MSRWNSRSFWKLIALTFTLALLVACGGDEEPTPAPTSAAVIAPTATAIPAEPTATPIPAQTVAPAAEALALDSVTVAVNAEFKPFVFLDENGAVTGFDIDLMNALAQVGGFELQYTDMPFEALLDSVTVGEYDVAISAITITDERSQRVDFTAPYFEAGQAPVSYLNAGQGLAVRLDNTTVFSLNDLTEANVVGVKQSTTGDSFVSETAAATVTRFAEAPEALQALSSGAVDAVVLDIPVIVDYIKTHPEAGIKLVGGPVTDEKYGIVVSKAKPEVLAALDSGLEQVRADGTYDALFNQWFGSP